MNFNDKLQPHGRLEIIKIDKATGKEEVLFDDHNVITGGLGQSIAQFMSVPDCVKVFKCPDLGPQFMNFTQTPIGGVDSPATLGGTGEKDKCCVGYFFIGGHYEVTFLDKNGKVLPPWRVRRPIDGYWVIRAEPPAGAIKAKYSALLHTKTRSECADWWPCKGKNKPPVKGLTELTCEEHCDKTNKGHGGLRSNPISDMKAHQADEPPGVLTGQLTYNEILQIGCCSKKYESVTLLEEDIKIEGEVPVLDGELRIGIGSGRGGGREGWQRGRQRGLVGGSVESYMGNIILEILAEIGTRGKKKPKFPKCDQESVPIEDQESVPIED